LQAKVADLIEKRRGISNKEVAVNARIAALEARKASLRVELCFIIISASSIRGDPVPSRLILEPTLITTIPSRATSITPSIADEQPTIGFCDVDKDIIEKELLFNIFKRSLKREKILKVKVLKFYYRKDIKE